ncbi:MAG: ABC transporter substrate-binding protein [Rhodoferax sp.]|nr:ABC transporter substrate-binding protein [Rhodoferax sp.]
MTTSYIQRSKRFISTAAFALCAASVPLASVAAGPSAASDKVTFGLPTAMGANNAPMAVAIGKGYFREEGLDVEIIFTGGSAPTVQATLSGQIDIGSATVEPVFQIREQVGKNGKVVLIYNYIRRPTGSIAVLDSSKVKSLADFKGVVIGDSSLGSGNLLLANGILAKAGLQVDKDFSHVAVGTGAAALNALTTGRVGALSLWDTEYAAMRAVGTKLRTFTHPDAEKLFSTTYYATPAYIEKNGDIVKRFGRAMAKATYFTSLNPTAALKIMYKAYPQTRTAGQTVEQELKKDLIALNARLELLIAGDPMKTRTWGKYEPDAIAEWDRFAVSAKIIKSPMDLSDLYTNKFVESYNDFDPAEIERDAKNWKE